MLVRLSTAWLVGLAVASQLAPQGLPLAAGALLCAIGAALWRDTRVAAGLTLGLCACLGALRVVAAADPGPGHISELNDHGVCTLRGRIAAEPDRRDRGVHYRVAVDSVRAGGDWRQAHGTVLVQTARFPPHEYGAIVMVTGELESPPVFETFDYRSWLAQKGVHSVTWRASVETVECCRRNPIRHVLLAAKGRARQSLAQSLPEPESALATGIVLGDARGIPERVDEAFRKTNTTHVIAISGSNVAVLVALMMALLGPVLGRRRTVPIVVVVLALYTALVGADAAVVRAALMGGVMVVGVWLGRPGHALTALMLSAWAMTAYRPGYMSDLGFQLSFAATAGLLAFTAPMSARFDDVVALRAESSARGGASAARRIVNEAVIVTLAAQVTTWPLIAYHVGQVSVTGLAANFLIVPAQSAVMVLGATAALAGAAWPPAGLAIGALAWLPLAFTIRVVELAARMPAASVEWHMPLAAVVCYYFLVGALALPAARAALRGFASRPRRTVRDASRTAGWRLREVARVIGLAGAHGNARQGRSTPDTPPGRGAWSPALAVGVACVLVWVAALSQPDGLLHLYVLDVGQGDALLVVTPNGRRMLVDGGPSPSAVLDGLGRHLAPWDRRLDVVALTHPDDDHVAGLPAVLDRYDVGLIVHAPPDIATAGAAAWAEGVRREGASVERVSTGARLTLDEAAGVTAEVLWPPEAPVSGTDADVNNSSVVMRLTVGRVAMLLTGDIESVVEQRLVRSPDSLRAAVLKLPHHGSGTSTTPDLVAAVKPWAAVVSVGADNSFGHPAPETLARLGDVPIFRTDVDGTVHVITDGRNVWVR